MGVEVTGEGLCLLAHPRQYLCGAFIQNKDHTHKRQDTPRTQVSMLMSRTHMRMHEQQSEKNVKTKYIPVL